MNARDGEAMTPLMRASLTGHVDTAVLLISRNANVNLRDVYGATALMEASWGGHVEIVRILLEYGADANLRAATTCRV